MSLMLKATIFRRPRRAVAFALMAALGGGLLAGCQQPASQETPVKIGYSAWPGWFQLAQVDGHLHRADAFEDHLRQALRYGFSFRMIEGQPAHVQARAGQELDSDGRDRGRAAVVREALKDFPEVVPPTA